MRGNLQNGAVICLTLIVLAGVFFRLYNIDRKTFWEDEALGAMHMLGYTEGEIVLASPSIRDAETMQRYFTLPAGDSLQATVRSLALEDPQHPPLYYLLAHLWVRFFGSSVLSIRSLSVLMGILVLPCAYWLARELFGDFDVAAAFTMLVGLSPFYVLYSQEAREYSFWTVTTLLMCVAFLRALRLGGVAAWTLYAVSFAVSLYVFPLSVFVALGHGLYLLARLVRERARFKGAILAYAIAVFAAGMSFVPWLAVMLKSPSLRRGMGGIASEKLSLSQIVLVFLKDVRGVFFDIGNFHLGPFASSAPNALLLIVSVALVVYALYFVVRRSPFDRWGFIVVGLCCPPLILVARDLLYHGSFVYQARYFIPVLLGLQLAVAFFFARNMAGAGQWRWRIMFAALLTGEAVSCLVSSQARTWWNKDYERSPAVAAIVNGTPGALVVSAHYVPSILDLSLYLRPDVALRLDLKCAQCALTQAVSLPEVPLDRPVFVLGIPGENKDGIRLIDARPHPVRADDLNMFAAI
jgi:uncharacterized membrane protein